jgi:hypothetical protein
MADLSLNSAECEHGRLPFPSAEVEFGILLKPTLETDISLTN